jgi:hypothetical protein
VSDTARERAEEVLAIIHANTAARPFTSNHDRSVLARDVLALLAERDELKRDLHFSETMHQADLDERVKIEKDCRALRERVAAAESENQNLWENSRAALDEWSERAVAAEERVAALEEALRLIFDNSEFLQVRLQHLVNDKVFREASALAGVPVAEEGKTTKCRACGREFPKRFGQDFCDDCSPHVRGVPVAEEET